MIQDLLNENPQLFTTEGFISLLNDYQIAITRPENIRIHHSLKKTDFLFSLAGYSPKPQNQELLRRVLTDPKGWSFDADPEVQKGCEYYANLGKFFALDDLTGILLYHTFRDRVREWQRQFNISGLVQQTVKIRDRQLTYHCHDCQLTLLPHDEELMIDESWDIAHFFVDVAAIAPKYDVFIEDEEEQLQPYTNADFSSVLSAEIQFNSYDWIPFDDGWRCKLTERQEPDKIELLLRHPDDEYTTYVALHPDKDRFPWMD
ncbi:hypothetical protein [Nostoc sp. FACHB-190]|uniref:hypothetical protein n=1 Tax=Nostoc sp. FACHB-190 TaxID=2692838 RepID=UPI001686FF6F|nr:hypothetical protein [Nostoc sp. FACHB-190]MBD2298934.1 hypothetical protein [Nostoc sp. FACHB-190]